MKTTHTLILAATLSAGLLAATGANATLVPALGGQVVNDTDLNITWLANANLAATNTFGLARNVNLGNIPSYNGYFGTYIYDDGRMTWGGAMKWIAAMNAANYLGYNNWRLPNTTDMGKPGCNSTLNGTDCGYNSIGSEMAHLYYSELGNLGYASTTAYNQPGYGLVNKGPFTHFMASLYWSGPEYALYDNAWNFNFADGYQNASGEMDRMFAFAVRSGQVATVPVPAAGWLFGSGLLGLIGVARRRL